MNNKDLKLLRGQIRQIVKELLPEMVNKELMEQIQKAVTTQVSEGLNKINENQKNLQSYLMRSTTPTIRPTVK